MKFFVFLLVILASVESFSQQNFFNVPSSDITSKGKIFFQQQVNVLHGDIQFNSTFDYGLGQNFEIGLNYLGLNVLDDNRLEVVFNDSIIPFTPFLAANFQKRFNLTEHFAITLGGQSGFSTTSKPKLGGTATQTLFSIWMNGG